MSRLIRMLSLVATLSATSLFSLDANAAAPPTLGLNSPSAMAISGSTMWIAEQGSNSLMSLNAATGAYISTIGPSVLRIASPDAVIAHGPHVYVSGVGGQLGFSGGNGVEVRAKTSRSCAKASTKLAASSAGLIEICSNGTINLFNYNSLKLLKSVTASTTKLTNASAVVVVKTDIFVTYDATVTTPDEVVEYSLPSFTKVATLSNQSQPKLAFSTPMGIGFDGTDLWVTNSLNDTLTEISRATLKFVAVISADHSYNLWGPHVVLTVPAKGLAPATIYVTNVYGTESSMVTRFTSSSSTIQHFDWTMCNTNDAYVFYNPSGIARYNNILWVVNRTNGVLDEMDATSGVLIHAFS